MVTGTAAARAKILPSAKAEKDSNTRASAWNNQRCTKIILATSYQNADVPATVNIIPSGLRCNSSISPCGGWSGCETRLPEQFNSSRRDLPRPEILAICLLLRRSQHRQLNGGFRLQRVEFALMFARVFALLHRRFDQRLQDTDGSPSR